MKLKNFAIVAVLVAAPAFMAPTYAGPVAEDVEQTGHDMKNDAKGAGHSIKEETKEAALTTKVKAALAKEKGLRSLKIHVDSEDGGVVTLTGKVKSTAQVEQAESATKLVEGVTTVNNKLEVQM